MGGIVLPLILLGVGVYSLLVRLDVIDPRAYDGSTDGKWILAVTENEPAALYAINVVTREKYKLDQADFSGNVDPISFQIVLSDHNRRYFNVPLYGFRHMNYSDKGISGYILPDHKHLIYAVRRPDAWDIVLSTLDGKNKKTIAAGLITPRIAIAPEGGVLNTTFIRDDGWSLEIYSTRTGKRLSNPINHAQRVSSYPSPDGRYVLYWATTQDDKQGLYLADAQGERINALLEGDTEIVNGVITPDGKQIVYQLVRDTDTRSFKEFWTVDLVSRSPTKIYTSRGMFAPWGVSPAGKYLVVHDLDDEEQGRVIDLETGKLTAAFSLDRRMYLDSSILFGAKDRSFIYKSTVGDRVSLGRYDSNEKDMLASADELEIVAQGGENRSCYLYQTEDTREIYVYDFTAHEAKQLARGGIYELLPDVHDPVIGFSLKDDILEIGGPRVSDILDFDGTHLLARERSSGALLIYKGSLRGFVPIKTPGLDPVGHSFFADKGKYIAFQGIAGDSNSPDVYVVDSGGRNVKRLLPGATLLY